MLIDKEQLKLDAEKCGVPYHSIRGLVEYAFERTPVGDFLYAVLSNNLMESFDRADEKNRYGLFRICEFIYNYMPAACHGSPEKVRAWLNKEV